MCVCVCATSKSYGQDQTLNLFTGAGFLLLEQKIITHKPVKEKMIILIRFHVYR